MESEKWNFSSAYEADLAHFAFKPLIAYGFPQSNNMRIIIKKTLALLNSEFIFPFICFSKLEMNDVLGQNTSFIEDGVYHFTNAEGKRELHNYPVKTIEQIFKIVNSKYKNNPPESQFLLEKSTKKYVTFQGNQFEFRVYVLVIRSEKKFFTFLYPSFFVNFTVENIDKTLFLSGLKLNEETNGLNPLLVNIYKLVQKTSIVLANYLNFTNKIYDVENEIKNMRQMEGGVDSEMQFNLYGLDIVLNEERKPFLMDIVSHSSYNVLNVPSKITKEKTKMHIDIVENFILPYYKDKKFECSKSDFIVLKSVPPNSIYKFFISKKIYDEISEDRLDISLTKNLEISDYLTPQGELLVEHLLYENKNNLNVDNYSIGDRFDLVPLEDDKFIGRDYLFIDSGVLAQEYTTQVNFEEFLGKKKVTFNDNPIQLENPKMNDDEEEEYIQTKITEMINKEKKNKLFSVAKNTLPLIGMLYFANKTYNKIKDKKINVNIKDRFIFSRNVADVTS